jgi:hypothetical protein
MKGGIEQVRNTKIKHKPIRQQKIVVLRKKVELNAASGPGKKKRRGYRRYDNDKLSAKALW